MINMNVVDGKIVGIVEASAPIPNRTANVITESGNYGLADNARKMFKSMCVPQDDEEEDREEEEEDLEVATAYQGGLGRGRRPVRPYDPMLKPLPPHLRGSVHSLRTISMADGTDSRSRTTSEDISEHGSAPSLKTESVKYVTECLFDRGEEVTAGGIVDTFAKKGLSRVAPAAPPKAAKANGYVMYLQHMRKTTGVTEHKTTDQLIKMFDKDWKALSENERQEWKEKAKAMRPAGSTAPPCQQISSASKMKNASRANSIARSLTSAGLIDDDGEDDEW